MSSPFEATALTSLYNGSNLANFRTYAVTIGAPDLSTDIESLDRRIASFEKVTMAATASAATSADYPYDEAGLKREFLEEVLALLIRSAKQMNRTGNGGIALRDGTFQTADGNVGDDAVVLYDAAQGTIATGAAAATGTPNTGGYTNFANYAVTELRDYYFGANSTAAAIFNSYSSLITETFKEGAKVATDTSDPAEVTTAIPVLVIDGLTYNRLATIANGTGAPLQYLVQDTTPASRVLKTTELTDVGGTGSPQRLQLLPREAARTTTTGSEEVYELAEPAGSAGRFSITLTRDPATGRVVNLADITLATNTSATVTASDENVYLPMTSDPLQVSTLSGIVSASQNIGTIAGPVDTAFKGLLLATYPLIKDEASFETQMAAYLGTQSNGSEMTFPGGTAEIVNALREARDRLNTINTQQSRTAAYYLNQSMTQFNTVIRVDGTGTVTPVTYTDFERIRKALFVMAASTSNSTATVWQTSTSGNGVVDIFQKVSATDPTQFQTINYSTPERILAAKLTTTTQDLITAVQSDTTLFTTAKNTARSAANQIITDAQTRLAGLAATDTTAQRQAYNDIIAQAQALITAIDRDVDPLVPNVVTSRRFTVGTQDYLVSLNAQQDSVYVTSLGPDRRSTTAVKSLSGPEYLLHMNEVRIKILRGQLAYNEAVVREIQDDLRRANEALADLEKQSGALTASDDSQYSAETLKLDLFNAVASKAGVSMFERAGPDTLHRKANWAEARTVLKNYIDRRSSEAQQATLDYQNVLNRYNNAYEVMAKLQEKIDNLLKSQLRNFN